MKRNRDGSGETKEGADGVGETRRRGELEEERDEEGRRRSWKVIKSGRDRWKGRVKAVGIG